MIGRKLEIEILHQAYTSTKPELVAVLGRRRIGKTYLIRNFFRGKLDFEMVGLKAGTQEQQLRNFAYSLRDAQRSASIGQVPADWLDAFFQLRLYLESLGDTDRKKVVFIDELPWIATRKSDFLTGFSYFWNSYASNANIIVIICGSATAWMINKIMNDRGGLHNRVSRRIHLSPFTLAETEAFFQSRGIFLQRYQILQLYMALGGVPHYLDQVEGGKSAVQNIDALCFHPQGVLRTEFSNLYSSLFAKPERYEAVVTALAGAWHGMSRRDILQAIRVKDGGGLSNVLRELEMSGFISSYVPMGKKKKDTLYRLSDQYSLFYLKFIRTLAANEAGHWDILSQTQSWKSWSGYAFENICLTHIEKIRQALGISGVHTRQYSFLVKGDVNREGLQIDMLIDRQDNSISMCEIKFYSDTVRLDKTYAEQLRHKVNLFRQLSQTRKQLFLVLITTFGLERNIHSIGLVDQTLVMDDLF